MRVGRSLILIVVCRVLMKLSRTQGPRQHMMLPYSPAIHGKKLDMILNCFYLHLLNCKLFLPFLSLYKFDDEQKQNQPRNTEQMKSKTETDANGKNSLEVMEPALDEHEVVLTVCNC